MYYLYQYVQIRSQTVIKNFFATLMRLDNCLRFLIICGCDALKSKTIALIFAAHLGLKIFILESQLIKVPVKVFFFKLR